MHYLVLFLALILSPAFALGDVAHEYYVLGQGEDVTSLSDDSGSEAALGTVVETMNSDDYTFVQLTIGSEKVWVAAPEFAVKVGDSVAFDFVNSMQMPNYMSRSLNRSFEIVYFCVSVEVRGAPSLTVAELYADKEKLNGRKVKIQGKVVKYTEQIMGMNWLRIQDGTGAVGKNEIIVTTSATAQVGDTVMVDGVLIADKDFGYGYVSEVFVKEAAVTIDKSSTAN